MFIFQVLHLELGTADQFKRICTKLGKARQGMQYVCVDVEDWCKFPVYLPFKVLRTPTVPHLMQLHGQSREKFYFIAVRDQNNMYPMVVQLAYFSRQHTSC